MCLNIYEYLSCICNLGCMIGSGFGLCKFGKEISILCRRLWIDWKLFELLCCRSIGMGRRDNIRLSTIQSRRNKQYRNYSQRYKQNSSNHKADTSKYQCQRTRPGYREWPAHKAHCCCWLENWKHRKCRKISMCRYSNSRCRKNILSSPKRSPRGRRC